MPKTSQFTNYLVVNIEEETTKTLKTKPSSNDLKPFERVYKIPVTYTAPEYDLKELKADIEIDGGTIRDAALRKMPGVLEKDTKVDSELPRPVEVLGRPTNKASEIMERCVDEAKSDSDLIDWLRRLYGFEVDNRGSDSMLELIESMIVKVRQRMDG